ncbi:hypothetical protein ABTZ03_19775 [Kitasatospora sp. NPDC096077]|uniref:hypothetical protein n=1 Tax=Kitasatospora sp. NPDC096077 TaxID=3155544 RepID=UPI00331C58C1
MRIRPIMLIAATATAAALATAGGMATAATGTATPAPAAAAKPSAAPTATPTPQAPNAAEAGPAGTAAVPGKGPSAGPVTVTPSAFKVTSTATSPIDAATTAKILASCLGSEASQYHSVIAVRTPTATADTDGVVVAVNSAKQYVQCESKGAKGTSSSVPATFINDRLWGVGHLVEFFDDSTAPVGGGKFLTLGAGHYTPDVAKVTISYGDDPTQYPAVMADGAFVYTAAISTGKDSVSSTPNPYVHAFNAAGKEIYNQKTQPNIKGAHQ